MVQIIKCSPDVRYYFKRRYVFQNLTIHAHYFHSEMFGEIQDLSWQSSNQRAISSGFNFPVSMKSSVRGFSAALSGVITRSCMTHIDDELESCHNDSKMKVVVVNVGKWARYKISIFSVFEETFC